MLSAHSAGPSPVVIRRVMFFIDGEYFRKGLEEYGLPVMGSLQKFKQLALRYFFSRPFMAEVIRCYWYDAEYDKNHEKCHEQADFFKELSNFENFEIKTGEVVISAEGERQKGVDVLIAVDMLTKSYENHYDIAILVAGDRDFIPLIKAVKDQAGKNVYGIYYSKHCSDKLKEIFDKKGAIGFSQPKNEIFIGSGAIYK